MKQIRNFFSKIFTKKVTYTSREEQTIYLFKVYSEDKNKSCVIAYNLWLNCKDTGKVLSFGECKKILSTEQLELLKKGESIFSVNKQVLESFLESSHKTKNLKFVYFNENDFKQKTESK